MYIRIENCLCCGNPEIFTILDLGMQPPANAFRKTDEPLPETYELKLMGCAECSHAQLSIAVDPDILFQNYPYVSGTSDTYNKYLFEQAEQYSQNHVGAVLDIGSNDGTFLDKFKEFGWETYGVDPAANLNEISSAKGHNITTGYWGDEIASSFIEKFDLITAVNVFAHTRLIDDFLQACKKVMFDDSILVIQTSQADMFANFEFDTVYHEHINFFSVRSMYALAERNGLFLNRVYKTDIHGISFVFELGLTNKVDDTVPLHLENENKLDPFAIRMYTYNQKVLKQISNVRENIEYIRVEEVTKPYFNGIKRMTVVGYGAPAKAMTLLNAAQVQLDYIVDENPLKQWRLSPGMNIPVIGPQAFVGMDCPVLIIILAWNFYAEISRKIKEMRPNYKDVIVPVEAFMNFSDETT